MSLDALYAALTTGAGGSRRDGLGSVFESLGGQVVGERQVRLTSQPTLGPNEVEAILAHDWRGRREITQPMGDLVLAPVKITGLPAWVDADAVNSYIEGDLVTGDLGSSPIAALGELWGEGESYGGAVLIAVGEDGQPSSEPLDLGRLTEVIAWKVLDRYSIRAYRSRGPGTKIDYWVIQGRGQIDDVVTAGQVVHPSRVIAHRGMWMPGRWVDAHDGWGLSRLELLQEQRAALSVGGAMLGRLLARNSQDVVALAELSEIIESEGLPWVTQKANAMAAKLDSSGVLMLDGGKSSSGIGDDGERKPDTFTTMARPMGGASDIYKQQHQSWRSGSSMPTVVADGEVSGGISSGAEAGAWRAWGGVIGAIHASLWTPWLNWQLGLIFASTNGPTNGRVPETWAVEWESIAGADPEVEAKIEQLYSAIDRTSIEMGIYGEGDARKHRNLEGKTGRVRVETAAVLPMPKPEAGTAADARYEHDKACVIVEIPDSIAQLFPYKPDDTSPPHVTVLFVGPTPYEQITEIRESTAKLAVGLLPMVATIGELGYFERPDGGRVAWVGVEFDADVAELHEQLRAQLMADGVMVQHPGRPFTAHATLAYLEPGEDYAGNVPTAGLSWQVERLEVWHGDHG